VQNGQPRSEGAERNATKHWSGNTPLNTAELRKSVAKTAMEGRSFN
jgi:hypothetical protein